MSIVRRDKFFKNERRDDGNSVGGVRMDLEDGMSSTPQEEEEGKVVTEMMTKHKIPDGEDGQEPFAEILAVMDLEELIRFRHRLGKIGRKRMVKMLSEEIAEREKE
jgi:hypothetical protein